MAHNLLCVGPMPILRVTAGHRLRPTLWRDAEAGLAAYANALWARGPLCVSLLVLGGGALAASYLLYVVVAIIGAVGVVLFVQHPRESLAHRPACLLVALTPLLLGVELVVPLAIIIEPPTPLTQWVATAVGIHALAALLMTRSLAALAASLGSAREMRNGRIDQCLHLVTVVIAALVGFYDANSISIYIMPFALLAWLRHASLATRLRRLLKANVTSRCECCPIPRATRLQRRSLHRRSL